MHSAIQPWRVSPDASHGSIWQTENYGHIAFVRLPFVNHIRFIYELFLIYYSKKNLNTKMPMGVYSSCQNALLAANDRE